MISPHLLISKRWNSLSAEPDSRSGLCSRLDIIGDVAVDCLYNYIPAQDSSRIGNLYRREDVIIHSLKFLMPLYIYFYQQIPAGAAVLSRLSFSAKTDALAVVDSGRNRNLQFFFLACITLSMTVRAFFTDYRAFSSAGRTGRYILHHAKQRLLGLDNLSPAAALSAFDWLCSRFCAIAAACLTLYFGWDFNLFFRPKARLFKGDFYLRAQICPSLRCVRVRPPASSSKAAAKQISKYIAKTSKYVIHVHICKTTAAGAALKGSVAKLVVLLTLLWVTKNSIRFRCFFKFCFCLGIPGICVRMILLGKNAIRFLQCSVVGISIHTENFVIITFVCHRLSPPFEYAKGLVPTA